MTRWMLAILLMTTPAFAASMNTYASQMGGANLVQLIPGELPLLTTTFAHTALQSTFPTDLVFETNVAPVGTLTLAYTLTIGGQQFMLPTTTYSCTQAAGCFFPADLQLPTFSHATSGTLVVNFNGSATEFGFLFQSPVPEPTSLVLLSTGLTSIAWRKYRGGRRGPLAAPLTTKHASSYALTDRQVRVSSGAKLRICSQWLHGHRKTLFSGEATCPQLSQT